MIPPELRDWMSAVERRLNALPDRWAGEAAQSINAVWIIQGSNTLVSPPTTGIKYVSSNVSAGTLPIPVITPAPAPGSTVDVDAANPPAGMPDGTGTARAMFTDDYAFVLNDTRRVFLFDPSDLRTRDKVYATDTVVLTTSSGGVTYRYTFLLPEARN